MSIVKEVLVPDIGDFADVEIVEVHVKAGDTVAADDPLITLETDKAAMDIPSPFAGTVMNLMVGTGDTVSEGSAVLTLSVESESRDTSQEPAADTGGPEAPSAPYDATVVMPRKSTPTTKDVVVPDIGDFEDVEIVEVHVSDGDRVAVDDPLITLETDKAAMDIPSPFAGTVTNLAVTAGDKVSEGSVVLSLSGVVEAAGGPDPAPPAVEESAPTAPPPSQAPTRASAPAAPRTLPAIDEATFSSAHAGPSVRKFARELGVNLGSVRGTGVKQRIIADDVKSYVKSILSGGGPAAAALPQVPKVDFARFGPVDIKPLTRVQKISGPRLHASWVNLPHVTQHDEADITDLEVLRKELKPAALEQDIRLTPLAFLVAACVRALKEFPQLNSSLDEEQKNLVFKHYHHIGFAADTPNGLVVPVIRDADAKSLFRIARDLGEMSAKARDGKLPAADMSGGSFTISSLGGIGGTAFTPIINAPEVAILGVSRSTWKPVYLDGEFVPRLMLPLSLSYDHRVIDGAMAVRFTTYLAAQLADAESFRPAQDDKNPS